MTNLHTSVQKQAIRWTTARLKSLLVLALLTSSVAHAKYGDFEEVTGGSPIPDGWVIVRVAGPSLMGTGLTTKIDESQLTYTIKDLNGPIHDVAEGTPETVWKKAKVGIQEQVRGNSPIPNGWVIIKVAGPSTMSTGLGYQTQKWEAVHTIKCVCP
jgi:hypothetical protein